MKKMQAFLAALLLSATSISGISSYAISDDDDEIFTYDNWKYTISGNGNSVSIEGVIDTSVTSITIPAEIEGLPVTYISDGIGYGCFADCPNLAEILADEENTYFESVDGVLFSEDLKKLLEYPVAREAEVYAIPDGTKTLSLGGIFNSCKNLKEITIPETVTLAESSRMFSDCTSLEKITNLGLLSDSIFISNSHNLKEIDLKNPENLSTVSSSSFRGLKNLETLIIPENYDIFTALTIQDCPKLNHLELPGHMSSQVRIFVSCCDNLESLDFSNVQNDEPMYDYDYPRAKLEVHGCAELKELRLPEVSSYCITDCPKLTSLSFDTDSYAKIELQKENSGLQDLYFYSTNKSLANVHVTDSEYVESYLSLADMGVTVHCRKANQYMQEMCEENNIPYVIIEDEIVPGDVCGDGELDITDVVMLNRIVVGVEKTTTPKVLAGDLNGNGKLELTDSMAILRKLVGLDA